MTKQTYSSAKEAEEAFYHAFKTANLEAMMHVWLDADYVKCIHPMSHRLIGTHEIQQGWQEVFSHHAEIQFETIETHQKEQSDLAIHVVNEKIKMKGNQYTQILVTNIYENTPDGWHMILHHASPAPQPIVRQTSATVH